MTLHSSHLLHWRGQILKQSSRRLVRTEKVEGGGRTLNTAYSFHTQKDLSEPAFKWPFKGESPPGGTQWLLMPLWLRSRNVINFEFILNSRLGDKRLSTMVTFNMRLDLNRIYLANLFRRNKEREESYFNFINYINFNFNLNFFEWH